MSWRDDFQPGSFRGAGFRTEGHERSGGRRVTSYEFPGRDDPLTEDLGRRQRQFRIDCHVIGQDYRAQRDALIAALEEAGPGLLIHPWHGQMMVAATEYSSSESTEDGGLCRFSISFAEAGQPVAAPIAAPAGKDAATTAAAVQAGAAEEFSRRFSIQGVADYVETAASGLLDGMATVARVSAALQGGIGPTLRTFEAGLRFLPANMSALLRAPLNLGHAVLGLVTAVSALGGTPRARIGALTRMVAWEPTTPQMPEWTPSRRREAGNRRALLWLFRVAAGSELARIAAEAPYASYDEAIATRDAVAERFDRLALDAADLGDDAGAATFDQLRRAMVRDITVRGASLARLYAVELAQTEPALVLANRVYGVEAVAARADDIAARNRLPHPGFVPGGVALQLLTRDAVEGAVS